VEISGATSDSAGINIGHQDRSARCADNFDISGKKTLKSPNGYVLALIEKESQQCDSLKSAGKVSDALLKRYI
jgi:hypothetical protein